MPHMGKVSRGGYIILWWKPDHEPRHVTFKRPTEKDSGASTLQLFGDSKAGHPAENSRNHRRSEERTKPMKAKMLQLKKPFGTARMIGIAHVRYLAWEDAFDVEFEDGLSFLEPHETIRRANQISHGAVPVEVILEPETRLGFEVRYDTGEVAEASWAFIRELPPKKIAAFNRTLGRLSVPSGRDRGDPAARRENLFAIEPRIGCPMMRHPALTKRPFGPTMPA